MYVLAGFFSFRHNTLIRAAGLVGETNRVVAQREGENGIDRFEDSMFRSSNRSINKRNIFLRTSLAPEKLNE